MPIPEHDIKNLLGMSEMEKGGSSILCDIVLHPKFGKRMMYPHKFHNFIQTLSMCIYIYIYEGLLQRGLTEI
jgi:hypothetical protein